MQILTVHAAKGLEWEIVAVPHLVSDVFPEPQADLVLAARGDRAAGRAAR